MINDSCTFTGAQALARQIEEHWLNAGYPKISTTLDRIMLSRDTKWTREPLYQIRSNIGAKGYPPR